MSLTKKATAASRVKVVKPDSSRVREVLPGVGVALKLEGADTGGALSIVEHPFDVGASVPPHIHTYEDEFSIVLEGEIGFRSEDKEVVLGPGGYIVKPRGEVHAMWNAGSTPARMIEVISPAGLEQSMAEYVDLVAAGADEAQLADLDDRYGCHEAHADWWDGVVNRFNLTPHGSPNS